MKTAKILWPGLVVLCVSASAASAAWWQQDASAGTTPVSIVVSVEAKHGKEVPTVYKQDVKVTHDKDHLRVADWTPCQSPQAGVELFLLIDDAIDTEVSLQFEDLKKFIQAQPPTTLIGVGYARNGVAQVAQDPSNDHAQAAKALRLPMGIGATASPYLSVIDLIKRWPERSSCRQVLMISSGIDFLQGGPDDTYMLQSIDQAQRAGVQIYAIYAQAIGHMGHSFFRLNWGQNNLSRLTDETGGEFYIQGVSAPIAYAPYLTQYSERFTRQYRLTFLAKPGKKSGFQSIHVETEVTNADLDAQDRVYVPAAK